VPFLPEGGTLQFFDSEEGKVVPAAEVADLMKERLTKKGDISPAGVATVSRPRYLVRIDLGPQTTTSNALGAISFWRFPKMPNLEVIEQIYLCDTPGCSAIILPEMRIGPRWMCLECKKTWKVKDFGSGITMFSGPMDFWGEKVARYYERLGGLADILLLRRRQSIQKMTRRVLAGVKEADADYLKSHGGTDKNATEGGYFTMARIHQDISTGSSLAKRIESFLRGG
jgi:hypothetical protein